ncbi:thiamine-phosphate pyrophosphorylase [Arboricoccus pini]|uniref:Thiamine-phosphate synthase n=1 Tax=Arboricoccus pini TaxID=1963835 RepID=A0A212PZ11_9PROT|nr:thiamine phosphate synthase [Arboricoccus pini]SNB52351.1 thiamine-phosphate pyrophosphorylase [Arboricoccus pini]
MKPTLDLRCYAILDPERCRARDPLPLLAAAAKGGITFVQLRCKHLDTGAFVSLAKGARAILEPHGIPCVVNDRVDVALAAGIPGVHVGQFDMSPADARRLLGKDALIGLSVHHPHEADLLDPTLIDYAGMGPVYQTASKNPKDPPTGPAGLGRLMAHLRGRLPGFPICGIAGITAENAGPVIAAGADGVAVISDLFMADDPEQAAMRLRLAVDTALTARAAGQAPA